MADRNDTQDAGTAAGARSAQAPLPAATLALVRDAAHGLEVLLLQRNLSSVFVPGAYVFPGGGVDQADRSDRLAALCTGIDDADASGKLGIAHGGLAYWIAAIREAFEEAGILLAYGESGALITLEGARARRMARHRGALEAGEVPLDAMLREEGLRLAADRLIYFSHWVTPEGLPRRYDTRFFLAPAPDGQAASHCRRETIAHEWMRPAEALARASRGAITLRTPTLRTLELFAQFERVETLMDELLSERRP